MSLDWLSPQSREELEQLVEQTVQRALRDRRPEGQRFVSVAQAAKLYGVSERAVRARASRGRIVTKKSGRTVLVDLVETERLLGDS